MYLDEIESSASHMLVLKDGMSFYHKIRKREFEELQEKIKDVSSLEGRISNITLQVENLESEIHELNDKRTKCEKDIANIVVYKEIIQKIDDNKDKIREIESIIKRKSAKLKTVKHELARDSNSIIKLEKFKAEETKFENEKAQSDVQIRRLIDSNTWDERRLNEFGIKIDAIKERLKRFNATTLDIDNEIEQKRKNMQHLVASLQRDNVELVSLKEMERRYENLKRELEIINSILVILSKTNLDNNP